jgi:hypothetical protein
MKYLDDDQFSRDSAKNLNINKSDDIESDSINEHSSMGEDSALFDDNLVLDANQELPIRNPQSAYVIFGKMVKL